MIAEQLDQASERAGSRYGAFLTTLKGVLAEYQSSPPRDVRAFQAIRARGVEIGTTFLDTEIEIFRNDLYEVQSVSHRAAQTDMDLSAEDAAWDHFGEEMSNWYWQELGAQVWRDINALAEAKRRSNLMGQGVIVAPVFDFADRLGRRYQSEGHARQLYRHALLQHGIHQYALAAQDAGAQTLTITHPEPDHDHSGLVIPVDALANHLREVFHPNSRAFLKAEPV